MKFVHHLFITWRTFGSSFAAVWIATIASKVTFCSIFRDLPDLHAFAPLQIRKSSKFRHSCQNFDENLHFFHFFILWADFDEISSEFDEFWWILMNFDEFWWILTKISSKIHQKFIKFWWKNSSIHHFGWWTAIHQQLRSAEAAQLAAPAAGR